MALVPVFDFDGTLLDSDAALIAPFLRLGVDPARVTFGHVLRDECERLGIDVEAYLASYDEQAAAPYAGVAELVAGLDRWALCSNKDGRVGRAELARLGWQPAVALFADTFAGPKRLGPVLDALEVAAGEVLFVGDTAHDRACAEEVGARFALAGWNPRAAAAAGPDDVVLAHPVDLLPLLA